MVERRGAKRRVAVLGAGPSGMTAAYILSKDPDTDVHVFEAESCVGGMAKTLDLWNQRVDLGPHRFFSSDSRVNSIWFEMVGKDYSMVNRLTRIYCDKINVFEALRCCFSYAKEKIFPNARNPESFEEWLVSRFGRRLFEIFFKTYSEKLWGISCQDLDTEIVAQCIKKLSFLGALKSAIIGSKGNRHKTLIDESGYPHQGSGEVYERMASRIQANGGAIYLQRPVKGLWTSGQGRVLGIELLDGEFLGFDEVISSIPISKIVASIKEASTSVREASMSLRFRNTILVYLQIEGDDLFPDQSIYIHDARLQSGRVTNFRNWVPQLYGNDPHSILAIEYWCFDDDERWRQRDVELIDLASQEIFATGLLRHRRILDGHVVRLPRCYPVYERGYKDALRIVEDCLQGFQGLQVIGRYGAFKYNHQDQSILMGCLAAENILFGASHNLWKSHAEKTS